MGIVERREREKTEIRRKILDAARVLFAREGYDAVTMRRIAEAIEYSPTTIYHHFEDKDDVVKALCEEDFGRLFAALAPAGEAPASGDPVDAIRGLGRAYCAFGLAYPFHYRFMFLTPAKQHEVDCESPGHRSFALLRGAVERALASGRFRPLPADTIAQVLWAGIHGAVALLTTLEPQHWPAPPAEDLVEQALENGIRGFLVAPGERA